MVSPLIWKKLLVWILLDQKGQTRPDSEVLQPCRNRLIVAVVLSSRSQFQKKVDELEYATLS